ncbi:hypothetical protein BKA65DRAFT_270252 [Rhexocercosporidium sp. MPI-PUGE-AT-0058]|nr:hypothetical protein BKA65DRAFT_270252 [Rhexocercosporidium sp. MPI-PUGE-AT-0058]
MSSSIWMALMLLPWTARADGWDDFANNLATDLAPLLALFGEQVTKQYLSESLNWVDNFIFAMAPLGIITAVVSVIRVCGGSSLRAFVGRAQEGRGVAEAELCSSTSPDVCELWNNGGIARVFGQPQILEVVYDPDTGAEGLYDQDGMATEGIFLPKDYFGTPISSGKKFAVACKRWEEEDAGSHDAETSPGLFAPKPNLSLNIGITKPPKGVFVTGAVFGFSLQTSVLIFAAWATFIGKLKKDGETMRPWSFPLTCIGTICLGAGMFLCALLIERSTGERIFRWRGEQGKAPLRYYLQAANQTVGDQKFEAFAHRDRLEHYITSWKVDSSDSRTLIGLSEATLVWVAVGAALGGFILQFVGLRAMHSSVAMFQFGIIVVMAVVRAGLRTRRLDDNANSLKNMKDRLQGHELDWLAMKLEQDRFSELGRRDDSSHDAGFWEVMGPSSDFGLNNRLKVSVIEGENIPVIKQGSSIVVQQREKLDIASSPEEIAASDDLLVSTRHSASRILKHRARLARITASDTAESRWQAEIRTHAINLKNAIEETATLLFSGEYHYTGDWSDDARLAWPIRARVQVSNVLTATESISLHIKKVLKRWETDLSTLEAILSLWMWSLESDDFSGKLRDISKTRDTPSDRIFALGSNRETELAIRDFQLWVRTNASPVVGRLERLSTSSVLQSDQKRYFGWQTVSNNLPSSTEPDTVISVPTTNSIPMMCAQDVYSSFLDFTVKNLSGIGGGTSVRMMEQTAWPSASGSDSIQLSNPLADSIAAIFERNGLGSIADADLCLFSCLRKHSKLPSSDIAHERARENAMKLRSMGNWQKAENILKWIYEQCVAKFHDMQSSSSQTYRRNLHERRSGIVDAATDLAELWRKSMRESQNRDQLGYDGVVWMLNNSVDPLPVEIKNLYGWLAWAIACENGDEERKIMLRNVGADILPLPEDVMPGSLVIKSLLDAIRYQARAKSLLFLKRGKWVNEQDEFGRTPLIWAAINGWPDVVQSLLELGARPELRDRRNRNAFSYTAEKGWISVLQLLLGVVRDPDEEDSFGRTPISYAAEHGHTAAVEMIYNSGLIHIRSRDFQGRTILHQVAEAGDGNLALLLFTLGMKSLPKQQSVNLWTPLHVAVKNEAFGIVRLLLANGAELEAKTVAGETALHIAAKKNSLPVITFLLERNTSLTERDAKGWTALHGAAAVGNYEMDTHRFI